MRTANILAVFSCMLWLGMFYMGRSLTYGVYTHGKGIFPNSGQIDHYIIIPICVALMLAAFAWVFNGLRSPQPLVAISILCLVALLPYLFTYTGGM